MIDREKNSMASLKAEPEDVEAARAAAMHWLGFDDDLSMDDLAWFAAGLKRAVCERMPLEKALGLTGHWRSRVRFLGVRKILKQYVAEHPGTSGAEIHRQLVEYAERR
jgi:hypothetical protein